MAKRIYIVFSLVLLLALWALPVAAAESESVNLPGWVGGTLALIAFVLPLIVAGILRNKGSL